MSVIIDEIEKLSCAFVDLKTLEPDRDILMKKFGDDQSRIDYYLKQSGKVAVDLWFNDVFGWALSWCMSLHTGECGRRAALKKVLVWLQQKHVRDVFAKFNDVAYPVRDEKGQYDGDAVERYFFENNLIRADVEDHVNAFNGFQTEGGEAAV